LKRLDNLIREEHQAATVQVLKVTSGLKDGAQPYRLVSHLALNLCPPRRQESQCGYATDSGRCRRSKVYVITHHYRLRRGDGIFVAGNQIQQNVRKWFSPPDPSTNYNIACKAYHQRTTAWIFEECVFKDWESTASLLWIHGKRKFPSSFVAHFLTIYLFA